MAGWATGGGCLGSTTEGSVSPLVCTISVGPLVAVFSIIGIRSRRAGLKWGNKQGIQRDTQDRPNSNTKAFFLFYSLVQYSCDGCDGKFWKVLTHLMWSYFLKSALYSTALCCSSTSMLLPYIETTFLIRLKQRKRRIYV